jgi:hypothetical protein
VHKLFTQFLFLDMVHCALVDVAVLVDKASMLQPMYPCEAKVGVVDVAVLRDKVSMLSPLQWFVQLTWELQVTLNKHI